MPSRQPCATSLTKGGSTVRDPDEDPRRASGATQSEADAHAAAAEVAEPFEPPPMHVEEDRPSPRFLRLRYDWASPQEAQVIHQAHDVVDRLMVERFPDVYLILAEIQGVVRVQLLDDHGDPRVDEAGHPVWKRTEVGRIEEDYTRLTRKQMESLIGQITTRMFAWEQESEKMWMDAMMAKAQFEDRFAISYNELRGSTSRSTVDDRQQHASMSAADERYYTIYLTVASRRAQALVRSMDRLGQRIKDLLML